MRHDHRENAFWVWLLVTICWVGSVALWYEGYLSEAAGTLLLLIAIFIALIIAAIVILVYFEAGIRLMAWLMYRFPDAVRDLRE